MTPYPRQVCGIPSGIQGHLITNLPKSHAITYHKHMVASVSFVSTGTFNHVFPSLPMHTLLSSNFPRETRKFSWKQNISLSSNFPLHAWWGRNLAYLITSHWRAVPHQKSSAQLWTVSDDIVQDTLEQSLCQLLFRHLEHFNCGRKFRLCACLKRMNTEMCFCACVYMKSVRTTIIRQSNSIRNRQHTTRDSLGYHVFTN
jgi:hypothetical protein